MSIGMIAAMDRNRLIGNQDTLPWHLPDDLRYFKRQTMGKTMIMGRRTFQYTLKGCALPQRRHIVITRHPDALKAICANDAYETATSLTDALGLAKDSTQDIMIIGGRSLYQAAFPAIDTLYLTIIEHEFMGDCTFPTFDPQNWTCVEQAYHPKTQRNPYPFYTRILNRSHVSKQRAIKSPPHAHPPSIL